MKVFNIRFGLATNSSSTHSIVFWTGKNAPVPDDRLIDGGGEFGWEEFVASSESAKLDYLSALLMENATRLGYPDSVGKLMVDSWCVGHKLTDWDPDLARPYVDHQSRLDFPVTRESLFALYQNTPPAELDMEFFHDFKAMLLRNDVLVLGGNDNEGGFHLGGEEWSSHRQIMERSWNRKQWYWGRRDGDYWVLFCPTSGTKIRMSFLAKEPPYKATAPELVDLKITDACPLVNEPCYPTCYQASTPNQGHSDDRVFTLITALASLKVFEVAIGGGEPTFHPRFLEILEACRSRGIVPNFTTRSIHWMAKKAVRERILKAAGAFAVSVTTWKDLKHLTDAMEEFRIPTEQVSIQHVVGSADTWETQPLIGEAARRGIRTTLLGWKNTGRGTKEPPHKVNYVHLLSWIKRLTEYPTRSEHQVQCGWSLGVDTSFVKEVGPELTNLGIPKTLYTDKEGDFTCYIDAVNGTINRSSYSEEPAIQLEKKDWQGLAEEIKAGFARF